MKPIILPFGLCLASFHLTAAQLPPFRFGNSTGDIFTGRGDDMLSAIVTLPKPMSYEGSNVTIVQQSNNGYILLYDQSLSLAGNFEMYFLDLDTTSGGANQNEVWLRASNSTEDLILAQTLIAGNGTIFNAQAIIVFTWYNVEVISRPGPQHTFQLAMAYSTTGETWAILAYSQLVYFTSRKFSQVDVRYDRRGTVVKNLFTINSNATMIGLLNGTNCNRKGVYVHRINKGGPTTAPTKAPTKSPTKEPTKAPTNPTKIPTLAPMPLKCGLLGWSIFCPRTLCGIVGRRLRFCSSY